MIDLSSIDFSPLWISLRIASVATIISCFLGVLAARFMQAYQGKWRSLLESLLLLPMLLPPTVLGFLLLLLLGKNGPLGALLSAAGISVVFTWYAAVIAASVVSFPLMYKTTLSAFEQIDSCLPHAARTLGASEVAVFWRVTLPLSFPGLLAGVTLTFVRALGEFGATLMLAGNIPGRTQTLSMALYFAVEGGDFFEATLWSVVILGISLCSLILMNSRAVSFQSVDSFRWTLHRWQGRFLRVCGCKKMIENVWRRGRTRFFSLTVWSDMRLRTRRSREVVRASCFASLSTSHSLPPLLEVDIFKQLPGFRLAVRFVAEDKQPLGLLGASGAGKSLILRCIAGVETPDSGRIVLNGRVLFDSDEGIDVPSCDRKVGLLFQSYALFPHLTVAQNVAFSLRCSHTSARAHAIVQQQLAAVHLAFLSQRYPHELSGGQQQRVALARALASEPELLLLDEPFSALDTHLRDRVEHLLSNRLQHYQGLTVLVTHNLEEAYRLCDRLLVIDQGRAATYGRKDQVFEHPRSLCVARLTGCENFSVATADRLKRVYAEQWKCCLQTIKTVPTGLLKVGIRARHIKLYSRSQLSDEALLPNTFLCWLAAVSETPYCITLYIKLHVPSVGEYDYHLQVEVSKDRWAQLKGQPFPWKVELEPDKLILLETE